MVIFPNCKINIGLNVCRKRPDGFHDLQTFFYPLKIFDILEAVPSNATADPVRFSVSGSTEDITGGNICLTAFELLKERYPEMSPVHIYLHKLIPVSAGLGGGSADGAFTLILLNKLFRLNLSQNELLELALQLGSDCPFFILNQAAIATGRGEKLTPVKMDLKGYKFLIINPGIRISTAAAFSWVEPANSQTDYIEAVNQPVKDWKDLFVNDFEKQIFKRLPVLSEIKEKLYRSGALFGGMSGTGSTMFGIFPKDLSIDISWPHHYFVREVLP